MSFQFSFEFSDRMRDKSVITKNRRRGGFAPKFLIDLFVGIRVGDQIRQFLRRGDESRCRVRIRGWGGRHSRQFSTFQLFWKGQKVERGCSLYLSLFPVRPLYHPSKWGFHRLPLVFEGPARTTGKKPELSRTEPQKTEPLYAVFSGLQPVATTVLLFLQIKKPLKTGLNRFKPTMTI